MALHRDLDIGLPVSSSVHPCVTTSRYGAPPRVPIPTSNELWNQPRYWSGPSRYTSASQRWLSRVSTARCVEPDSNHTSRMSVSLRHFAWPQEHLVPGGNSSSAVRVNHTSAPSRSKNGST